MPDLDLELRGAPVIQTLRKGAARSPKEFFSALRPSAWSKNKGGRRGGGRRAPRAPPLDPPLDYVAVTYDVFEFFLSSFISVMRHDWLKLTTNPSLPTHPIKLTTLLGSMLSSSRKDVGCCTSYQSRIGTSADHWRRGKSTVFAFIREECSVDERTSRR